MPTRFAVEAEWEAIEVVIRGEEKRVKEGGEIRA